MDSGLAQILAVIAAGFSAGAINAVAAGGTLIAFPVLFGPACRRNRQILPSSSG
jgi:hypothetical protein